MRLRNHLKAFGAARHGGVAMMFALAMPVVSVMAVAGVDIHRASTVRMNLQDALDAAALAAARSDETTSGGIRRVGMQALRANLANYPDTSLIEAATDTDFVLNADGSVVAKAKANVTTLIADMFLGDNIKVAADTTVFRSNYRIEVAMVLDNTGSMAGSKLTNTKAAARNLVERLAAAAERSTEDDAVKISLVPFSMTVRIGSEYANANWMDNSAQATGNDELFATGANRLALFNQMNLDWAGCVESRPYPYDIRDTAPHPSDRETMFVHYFAPDEPDVDLYDNHWQWEDYRVDNDYLPDGLNANSSNRDWWKRLKRTQKYGTSGLSTSNGKGPNRGCTLQPLVRLTTDYDDVLDAIDDMTASGNTNVPMGMMWGWHTLSPNRPFADGAAYGTDRLQKIVILMTDGENVNSTFSNPNNSVYSGVGYIFQNRLGVGVNSSGSDRRAAMDNRLDSATPGQEDLCGNMKAQGIIIYTVGVQVDTGTQAMLARCATSSDHYFNVTSSAAIGEAFDRIAGSIENLRIAR
ncbi:pilus assembly protein TadG-related protein [Brevundimonas sp. 2R-24]|uniref:Pilus assembly protein TadG-related protein n=1 Tax=Peiella sedimenti TaxID=3061083 RepID=A0ABT8SKP2_9CAUL|nr:pilus assembly protein TadG-related protein [Caulobacteraceae bacterium XZ-24]